MISVIVPAYNEGQQPIALLESLAHIPELDEIVIVDASDDESSKATIQALPSSETLRVIEAESKGRAVQMNQGASMAKGDILLFLHCDTQLPLDAVAQIRQALNHHSWGRFDLRLDAPEWPYQMIEFMIRLRSRLTRIATGDQAIFIRRDFFHSHGGFAEIELMEDIEFSRRVGRRSRPGLVTSPVLTSARRWQKHGVIKTILLMWTLRLLYRLGVKPKWLAAMYRIAR